MCNPNPCRNGGTCREENNAAVCACSQQFEGKICESMEDFLLSEDNRTTLYNFLVDFD